MTLKTKTISLARKLSTLRFLVASSGTGHHLSPCEGSEEAGCVTFKFT